MKNNTKIKFLDVEGKLYEVVLIDFAEQIIRARKTGLSHSEVLDSEVFSLMDFTDFYIVLFNGATDVIDFSVYSKKQIGRENI